MDYQNLIDRVLAAPEKPGLAPRASSLVTVAAARLGRRTPPELAGVPNLLLRPNQEQPMSGELLDGHVVDEARPQYHPLDPIVAPDLASEAQQLLAPAPPIPLAQKPPSRPGLVPVMMVMPTRRNENPLRPQSHGPIVMVPRPSGVGPG